MPLRLHVCKTAERSWKAWFAHDPSSYGVGKSKAEAVASIYVSAIGRLILLDPASFGLEVVEEDASGR